MPTVAAVQSAYARAVALFDVLTLEHGGTDYPVRGRIFSETSVGLSDSIEQTRLRAIIQAEGLPVVPERGDLLWLGEQYNVIQSVDNSTRRLGGVVIAYEITL